jgi:hypothetical protein
MKPGSLPDIKPRFGIAGPIDQTDFVQPNLGDDLFVVGIALANGRVRRCLGQTGGGIGRARVFPPIENPLYVPDLTLPHATSSVILAAIYRPLSSTEASSATPTADN